MVDVHEQPLVSKPFGLREALLLGVPVAVALILGFSHLGIPSLWHDEAVQVLVARNLWETGRPILPSGNLHPVAPVFNVLLAGFIGFLGDSETVVRSPSVLLSAVNVVLLFFLTRRLLGRETAFVAAFALALSPWSLAWARQARFYTAQQTLYLLTTWAVWHGLSARTPKAAATGAAAALAAYVLGIGTSLHSILFIAPAGAYAGCLFLYERRIRSRWTAVCVLIIAIGVSTLVFYRLALPRPDADAIFKSGGIGIHLLDSGGSPRSYYLQWLWGNLGVGFFILAVIGFVWMLLREGRRGIFAFLTFWAPMLVLSLLISYRIHRFIFFLYPAYVIACAYGAVQLVRYVRKTPRTPLRIAACALIVLFGARLGLSAFRLMVDSLEVAGGAPITLATRHPEWREPCRYVRDRAGEDIAVLTTTFTPVLYYVGRVDNWFPSAHLFYEADESGVKGLATTDELAAFMDAHPRGYYIAEWFRLWHPAVLRKEFAWVKAHMTRIDEACSGDVDVYCWGLDP